VFVNVVVPTRMSRKQREALQAYAEAAGEPVSDGGGLFDRVRDALG
jgi:hypothetical protein